jgi:hypothetical protein
MLGPLLILGVAYWIAMKVDDVLFMRDMRRRNQLQEIKSTVNGRAYWVAHGLEAANALARVQAMAWQVVQELGKRLQAGSVPAKFQDAVRRLRNAIRSDQDIHVAELSDPDEPMIAFNRNKGNMIMLCMSNDGALVRDDEILFVLLHEITHTMTSGYDPLVNGRTEHSAEFMDDEEYVYRVATDMGAVRPAAVQGQLMCGSRVSHPHPERLPR